MVGSAAGPEVGVDRRAALVVFDGVIDIAAMRCDAAAGEGAAPVTYAQPAAQHAAGQPVVGVGLSALLLGEVLGPMFFAGGGLILLGVWLAGRR